MPVEKLEVIWMGMVRRLTNKTSLYLNLIELIPKQHTFIVHGSIEHHHYW